MSVLLNLRMKFVDDARFSNPGDPGNKDSLTFTIPGVGPALLQKLEFRVATDQRRQRLSSSRPEPE